MGGYDAGNILVAGLDPVIANWFFSIDLFFLIFTIFAIKSYKMPKPGY